MEAILPYFGAAGSGVMAFLLVNRSVLLSSYAI
jgi:hypothetical protein